jgi:tetratricopeptide (TPR) repeat protein
MRFTLYKRTILASFVVALLLIASAVSAQQGTTSATQIARVTSTAASVNLRSGPGQDYAVIQPVPNGTEVMVTDADEDQTWLRVRLDDGTEGWISAALLVIDASQTTAPTPVPSFVSTNSTAYVVRGNLQFDAGHYTEAVEAYTQALALEPDDDEIYLSRGRAYMWMDEYELALADFERAVELDDDNEDAYYERGNAYSWLSQYEEAVENYDRAIQLDDNTAYFYADRGNAYTWLNEYEQALEDYNNALRLDPDNSLFYDYRGNAYAGLSDYTRAIEDYNQAITLDPRNALAYFDRGVGYYNTKRYGKALLDFNHAIELNPDHPNFYGWRGFAHIVTGGTVEEIRADMCLHVELAGEFAYPEVTDVIEEQGWYCS